MAKILVLTMDSLSQLLSTLDQSQREEALRILQGFTSAGPLTYHSTTKGDGHTNRPYDAADHTAVSATPSTAATPVHVSHEINEDETPFAFRFFSSSPERVDAKQKERSTANALTKDGREESEKKLSKKGTPLPSVSAVGLTSFGFFSATKNTNSDKNRLFSSFVQDKRVVPHALRIWDPEGLTEPPEREAGAQRVVCELNDNESSLLHPPLCCVVDDAEATPITTAETFDDMVASSHNTNACGATVGRCPCPFHTFINEPYPGFDCEVIFCGFSAIGYEPCQARPPYYGTFSHLRDGNMNTKELLQMARFPCVQEMPRLSNLDYDYDSGDDWDALDGEDICGSSSNESSDGDISSMHSSDLDFINDANDGSDSDCELQQKIMEARQRRVRRLRGKEKLVPSFSGPFVGVSTHEHPLQRYDRLQRLMPLSGASIAAMLSAELNGLTIQSVGVNDTTLTSAQLEERRQQKLMEAALRNRREMTVEELDALHRLISLNNKFTLKPLADVLKAQQMCIGVAKAEFERTVKRFYGRNHGMYVRRGEPWLPTDERLFTRSAKKKSPARRSGSRDEVHAVSGTEDAEKDMEGDEDEDDDEEKATAAPLLALSANGMDGDSAENVKRRPSVKRAREGDDISEVEGVGDVTVFTAPS